MIFLLFLLGFKLLNIAFFFDINVSFYSLFFEVYFVEI